MRFSLKAFFLPLTLLLMLTAGCGSDNSDATATEITYWANPMTVDPELHARTLRPLLEEFTQETGIKVNLEMQDWTKVYPKIIAGIAAGSLPDVFDTGSTWAAALQATGGLKPFDSSALAEIGGRDKFLAASFSSTGIADSDPAAVPLYGQAYGLFYNPKLFAKAGITEPPATWDEFVSAAQKLTSTGQWGFALTGAAPLFNVHQTFILGRQEGAQLFSATGEPQFETPQTRAAVRRLLDLMSVEKVIDPSMIEKSGFDAVATFAQGKTGMVIAQSAAVGVLKTLDFTEYEVANPPTRSPSPVGGRPIQSMVAGTNLAVAASSPHHDAALQLVAFLTGREAQTVLSQAFGTIPVLNELQGTPPFDGGALETFARILSQHAEPMPVVPDEGAMEAVLGDELVKLWPKAAKGRVSDAAIDAALRAAQDRMPQR